MMNDHQVVWRPLLLLLLVLLLLAQLNAENLMKDKAAAPCECFLSLPPPGLTSE
jgi:hypothetical protein